MIWTCPQVLKLPVGEVVCTKPGQPLEKREESNRSCHDCRICGQVLLLFQTTKHNTKYFFPLYAPTCGHPIFQQCPKGRGGIRCSETMPRVSPRDAATGSWHDHLLFPKKNKTNSDTGIISENHFMNKRHWVYKYIITLYIYLKTCLPTPSMLWFNFYTWKSGFISFYASINLNWVVHLSFSEDLDRWEWRSLGTSRLIPPGLPEGSSMIPFDSNSQAESLENIGNTKELGSWGESLGTVTGEKLGLHFYHGEFSYLSSGTLKKQMGVFQKMISKIGVPPKSSILIGVSIINHPFWVPLFLENTHISTILV